MQWSKWIRQVHRWLAATFTVTVALVLVAQTQSEPPEWAFFLPLLPLAVLFLSGLYLFVLPYAVRWRSG
jgi:hypothetical protein